MRLAYFSPLNPAPSGVSDYSEELLPHLAQSAQIELVVDGYTPTNGALTSRFRVLDDRGYDARRYDLALYHLGNSPAHAYIYQRALREPGVIVLHDFVLHHLVAWLTLNHGNPEGYIQAMRDAYGERGAKLAQREIMGTEALNRFEYPLSERVLQNARGVIVHSRYVADAVKRVAPHVPIAQINHELPPVDLIPSDAARRALGLPLDAPLAGSFGNLGPVKRATVLLDAFRAVRHQLPNARLLLIGAISPNLDLVGLVKLFGLQDAVMTVGHVPFDAFYQYIAAVDVCVNLRYPTAGETSGAVLRMMAQAKPVIVSRVGWFAELPAAAVAQIEVDDAETELLAETLQWLLRDPLARMTMGANARHYVEEHCAVQDTARHYADFLQSVVEGRAESRDYSGTKDERRRTKDEGREARDELRQRTARREAREEGREASKKLMSIFNLQSSMASLRSPVSNLQSPTSLPSLRDELVQDVVALGLDEDDGVLRDVARAVVELGLDQD